MPVLLLPRGLTSVPAAGTFPAVAVEINFSTLTGWTNISPYADFSGGQQITITRGSNRVESPVIRYDAGTATIPLDNTDRRFDPTNLAGPFTGSGGLTWVTFVRPVAQIRVSATFTSVTYRLFNGTADTWDLSYSAPSDAQATVSCTDGFRVLAVQARTARTTFQGGGEDAGARVTRILNDCGWPYAKRSIVTGDSTVQPTLLGGTPIGVVPLAVAAAGGTQTVNAQTAVSTLAPLDELQLTAETEMGELYVNGNGFLVFRNRGALWTDTRSKTSQATFGDDPGVPTTELPYASVTPAYDDSTLWNGATIANTGGHLKQAADATSQQLPPDGFGPHVYDSENLIADSDFQALGYAQWIVLASKNPELRFSAITIDPIAAPATLFPQVLGREIGDRITIIRRPPQAAGSIPYASAKVTSPASLSNILFASVAAGTYTVDWTVTLAGTLAAADVNNFGIYNGNTFVAGSINLAVAGTYPQAPITVTVTGGAPDIKILSGGNTPTTGAVYGAMLPSPLIRDVFIRGIQHQFDDSSWLTTWILQDATRLPPQFIADDAINGRADISPVGF